MSQNKDAVTKGKRGRKSKKELMEALNMTNSNNNTNNDKKLVSSDANPLVLNIVESSDKPEQVFDTIFENSNSSKDNNVTVIKKRGRKPKGGKIIQQTEQTEFFTDEKPNVILHLKCFLKDLQSNNHGSSIESFNFSKKDYGFELYNNLNVNVITYNDNKNKSTTIYSNLLNNNNNNILCTNNYNDNDDEDDNIIKDHTKELWMKLKQLEHNLHINNLNNKKSCCFWDTCEYDTPTIYSPKYCLNGVIYVEGCYCSPQCAAASIINNPNLDSSSKFERLHLLNFLYGKIFDYKKNIVPAPNPYYMLDKYLGNLSINQYRSLLGNERLFLIVDKPLTRILPELHEYNDEFILNNKIIPSSNYQLKSRLQKHKPDKSSILNEKFGITNSSILIE